MLTFNFIKVTLILSIIVAETSSRAIIKIEDSRHLNEKLSKYLQFTDREFHSKISVLMII